MHCQGAARQPQRQLQNSCGAMQAWPVLHTEPGQELANHLQKWAQHFKTPFKKQEYCAYSPRILPAILAVGFGPVLPAWKSKGEDEWKFQVAELSPALRWLQPGTGLGREPGPASCEPGEQLLINIIHKEKLVRRNANIYLNIFNAFNLVCS